jgi:hypothetical protein
MCLFRLVVVCTAVVIPCKRANEEKQVVFCPRLDSNKAADVFGQNEEQVTNTHQEALISFKDY